MVVLDKCHDPEWVRKNGSKLGRRKMELKEGSEQEFEPGDFFLKVSLDQVPLDMYIPISNR
jgi:hypothetical protein